MKKRQAVGRAVWRVSAGACRRKQTETYGLSYKTTLWKKPYIFLWVLSLNSRFEDKFTDLSNILSSDLGTEDKACRNPIAFVFSLAL